jgi:hypothetical protein
VDGLSKDFDFQHPGERSALTFDVVFHTVLQSTLLIQNRSVNVVMAVVMGCSSHGHEFLRQLVERIIGRGGSEQLSNRSVVSNAT